MRQRWHGNGDGDRERSLINIRAKRTRHLVVWRVFLSQPRPVLPHRLVERLTNPWRL